MRPSASGGHRARDSLAGGCELVAVTVTQAVNCEARAKSLEVLKIDLPVNRDHDSGIACQSLTY